MTMKSRSGTAGRKSGREGVVFSLSGAGWVYYNSEWPHIAGKAAVKLVRRLRPDNGIWLIFIPAL